MWKAGGVKGGGGHWRKEGPLTRRGGPGASKKGEGGGNFMGPGRKNRAKGLCSCIAKPLEYKGAKGLTWEEKLAGEFKKEKEEKNSSTLSTG